MEAKRISVKEAKEKLDRGENILFLDVRAHPDSKKIKGAVHVPPAHVENHVKENPTLYSKGKTIITYCA